MRYDLVVIGGGSGGVRAARIAAGLGARVALVEARDLGGTCVNLGCVPKKLLAYGAKYEEHFQDAAGFGWVTEVHRFDWAHLIRNKNAEIERLNGVYGRILEAPGVEIVRGWGVVEDRHTVRVGDRRLDTERILIATGGRPWRPDVPGAEHALVSDDVFHLTELPESLVVVGGGYVAVELASILSGFGVQTELLYRGSLFLRGFDVEAREFLAEQVRGRGVHVHFDTPLVEIEPGAVVSSNARRFEAERVLLAVGREPVVRGMGLEEVGVELTSKGVKVDGDYQTSVPGIFAVGDVADRGPGRNFGLTPVALEEGMILAQRLFGGVERRMDYDNIATAVFCNPNFSSVGLSEEAAREQLEHGRVYTSSFRPMVHTLSGRASRVFMKMVVDDATDRVVGVHMVGPDAGELIQGLAVALRAGATKEQFDRTVGIHPTAAEEFVTMRTATRTW